ncbi:GNAT family N-acetyltransferase [Mesorhizobium opportunistum]|uniref:GNAT family N-acetyltransferase n=1 Tax=Mesorhizobium opportunistum TaxID=593909 RepID=A0ABV1Y9T1_9HYPH|nr:GNAT family N-acetyltransferase [Mesorhizobium sp.]TIN93967.1 MAG: GNAT family N-acetyltransferase [Mesorhizobium sp.]TJV01496.1 MAG: GNAT family N-acetyltransferase [Mesorhizobium sp.]TJV20109.1 MAG: GNAT family N-acetyltransferase [Mesorhizobium sp.]
MLDRAAPGHPISDRPIVIEAADSFDFGSVEYRRLFCGASASAFQHPDWLTAFYRNIAPAHGAEPLVITGRDSDGELQLVVPLVRRGDGAIEYAFLGVTDYACPIIATGVTFGAQTRQRFRDVLGHHADLRIGPVHHSHLHEWRQLLGSEPSALDFGAHAVRYGFPYAEWRRTNLGCRGAGSLDRKARRLAEAGGLKLELVGPDSVRQALVAARDFRAGRFPDDPMQTPHGLEFYIDVATNGARSGLARTYRLASKDGPVALVFGLVDGDCFRYILLACDYRAHARHSPGRVALDQVMAAWAAEGGKAFDFTIGDEPFKADFGCTRTTMHEFRP